MCEEGQGIDWFSIVNTQIFHKGLWKIQQAQESLKQLYVCLQKIKDQTFTLLLTWSIADINFQKKIEVKILETLSWEFFSQRT